jgi:DNA end-binding protein Ku
LAKGENIKLPSEQLELGMSLIEKMSSADFEPERYADECRERALAMIEKKVEGQEIKAVAPAPRRSGQVVDIFGGVKEELGNCWSVESYRRARQSQKEGVV